jgi:prepilin-type N-terminal cleavage/methylation domain-containing protein
MIGVERQVNTVRTKAFTLVEIMIVVLIIGLLLAIAVPNFMRARSRAQQRTCISNLRQIDQAKESFAMENSLSNGAIVVSSNIWPEYIKGLFPACPAGGTYDIKPIGQEPSCTFITQPTPHIVGQ